MKPVHAFAPCSLCRPTTFSSKGGWYDTNYQLCLVCSNPIRWQLVTCGRRRRSEGETSHRTDSRYFAAAWPDHPGRISLIAREGKAGASRGGQGTGGGRAGWDREGQTVSQVSRRQL